MGQERCPPLQLGGWRELGSTPRPLSVVFQGADVLHYAEIGHPDSADESQPYGNVEALRPSANAATDYTEVKRPGQVGNKAAAGDTRPGAVTAAWGAQLEAGLGLDEEGQGWWGQCQRITWVASCSLRFLQKDTRCSSRRWRVFCLGKPAKTAFLIFFSPSIPESG